MPDDECLVVNGYTYNKPSIANTGFLRTYYRIGTDVSRPVGCVLASSFTASGTDSYKTYNMPLLAEGVWMISIHGRFLRNTGSFRSDVGKSIIYLNTPVSGEFFRTIIMNYILMW